jgi:hypothetical protein
VIFILKTKNNFDPNQFLGLSIILGCSLLKGFYLKAIIIYLGFFLNQNRSLFKCNFFSNYFKTHKIGKTILCGSLFE